MKLVEILAKKLDVWPTGAAIAVQDGDARKTVTFGSKHANPSIAMMGLKDVWQARDWKYTHESDFDHSVLASDWKTAIVTKEQWQAERDRQKGGEWKRHRGNSQPVDEGTWVEVKLRCGDIQQGLANAFLWRHADCDVAANIMKYRVISQPQAEEVEVKDTTIGTLSYKVEIDTTEASQAIDDLTAKWDQIETPFKWRDEVTELNAYIEKYTRERDAIIERLASEGFALIPPVVSVVSEFAGADMSDWRNWKEGDVIEVIANKGGHEFETGHEVTVINIDEEDATYRIEATKDGEDWWLAKSDGKFIRRP